MHSKLTIFIQFYFYLKQLNISHLTCLIIFLTDNKLHSHNTNTTAEYTLTCNHVIDVHVNIATLKNNPVTWAVFMFVLTFPEVAAELCEESPWHRLTLGLTKTLRGLWGQWVLSVAAITHANINFHQCCPQSPIVNVSKPIWDVTEYLACL